MKLALQDQPFQVLAALLERPGEIVTREVLTHRLWPNGTFVDFEHSLNAAVRRLRVALGDDADRPRFIETVHRRGYRFLVWGPSVNCARTTPERTRLAVLPFVLYAAGATDDRSRQFGEALTEETTTQLALCCADRLGIIARSSVGRFAWHEQRAAEIGRLLGADFLLEGSLRSDGDRLRITAQLVDAHDETHVWAGTYDRVLDDVLAAQTDVGSAIARSVSQILSAPRPQSFREAAS